MILDGITADKGWYRVCAPRIDIAEQLAFNLITDSCVEKCRI